MQEKECSICSPLLSECVCHLITQLPYSGENFKFEYAHEMDTVPNTQFWKIWPED